MKRDRRNFLRPVYWAPIIGVVALASLLHMSTRRVATEHRNPVVKHVAETLFEGQLWGEFARLDSAERTKILGDLQSLLAEDPSNYEALILQGILATKGRSDTKSQENFEKAIRLQPSRISAHLYLAHYFEQSDLLEEALGALTSASEIDKNDPYVQYNIALVRLRLGQTNIDPDSRFPHPAVALTEISERIPNQPRVLVAHADALMNSNEYSEALESYKQAVSLEPDNISTRRSFTAALLFLQRSADAETQLRITAELIADTIRTTKIAPGTSENLADLHTSLAETLLISGNPSRARTAALSALRYSDFTSNRARRVFCRTESELGNPVSCHTLLKELSQLNVSSSQDQD